MELIPRHIKTADLEYDLFEIDGHRFVFDPQTISAFALDEEVYKRLTTPRMWPRPGLPSKPSTSRASFGPRLGTGALSGGGLTLAYFDEHQLVQTPLPLLRHGPRPPPGVCCVHAVGAGQTSRRFPFR
jgi:hypothetical protein